MIVNKYINLIFLGSRVPSETKSILQRIKITHVLNCAGTICKNHYVNDFVYKTLYLMDSSDQDISGLFYEVIDYIENARKGGGTVYVHCHQGKIPENFLDSTLTKVFHDRLPW